VCGGVTGSPVSSFCGFRVCGVFVVTERFFFFGLSSKFPEAGSFSSFAVAEFVEETLTVCM